MAPSPTMQPKKTSDQIPKAKQNPEKDWISSINHFKMHFGRFFWDAISIFIFAFGILVLLGILGLSKGSILSSLIDIISTWLGWGSFLIVIMAVVGGIFTFKQGRSALKFNWKKVVAIEFACVISLALLSIIGGNSITQVDDKLWGGRIGWSLVVLIQTLLGRIPALIVIIITWLLSIMGIFGLGEKFIVWLEKQAGQNKTEGSVILELDNRPRMVESTISEKKSTLPKKGRIDLPPEYRKNLVPPRKTDEKKVIPVHRGENLPPINLLAVEQNIRPDDRNINQTAGLIEKTLADFGIPATVVGFRVGPTVTQFAVEPGYFEKGSPDNGDINRQKVRIAQIAGLSRDLALALSAERLRIEAPVPGRSFVGIEVPNLHAATVRLRPILESETFNKISSPLALALGRDVSGQPVVADLARMPHILIAGTTGSGKSVCISSMATCLAMNNSPDDLRMVMIDSKMVELIRFNGLPHLLGKVETSIQRILGVLRWIVVEMERRYKLLEAAHVRDLDGYNKRLPRRKEGIPLPRIVVMIDELADLMMSAPDQTEHNLVRLAQMARATGIHLVVATQRPSTEVVTGLIKANFPARLSFAVASSIDSRVILDSTGAETLLGHGDMLFLNPEVGNPIRAQGVLITDQEIERMISYWQKTKSREDERPPWEMLLSEPDEGEDGILIEHAITLLRKENRASASMLQRKLRIGYPRAARLLDRLEEMGIVGPSQGGGRDRDVLLEPDQDLENGQE